MSECTELLGQKSGFGRVLDSGFSSCTALYWSVLALCRELVWIQHSGLHICIQKSGIRLGLVWFSFKEVRSYFRKVSGVVEMCGCGMSGLGSDVEHNKSEFQKRSHIFTGDLYFHKTTTGWLWAIISKFSGFVSVIYLVSNSLREPSESSNSLPVFI